MPQLNHKICTRLQCQIENHNPNSKVKTSYNLNSVAVQENKTQSALDFNSIILLAPFLQRRGANVTNYNFDFQSETLIDQLTNIHYETKERSPFRLPYFEIQSLN